MKKSTEQECTRFIIFFNGVFLTALLVFFLTGLTGCGAHDEYQKWEDEAEGQEVAQEAVAEESEAEVPPRDSKSKKRTPQGTKVKVSVEVEVTLGEDGEEYLLLQKGLTMDEVADILGEPDDSFGRAGPGVHWKYFEGRDGCKNGVDCNVYFNGDGELEYMTDIDPNYKNHRDY